MIRSFGVALVISVKAIQILVLDDLIGLSGFYPKFVKKYVNLKKIIESAVSKFKNDVKKGNFPKKSNSF